VQNFVKIGQTVSGYGDFWIFKIEAACHSALHHDNVLLWRGSLNVAQNIVCP